MITFCIITNFKGSKKEFAKALLICVCLDAAITLFALNY